MLSVITPENVIESLREDQRVALAQLAIKSSDDLGYCSETKNVIQSMGIELPRQTTILKVEIIVEHDFGAAVSRDYLEINYYDHDINPEVVDFMEF